MVIHSSLPTIHCHITLLFSLLERDIVIQFATHHSSSQYIVVLVVATGSWLYTVCYPPFIVSVHCCSRCWNGKMVIHSLLPTIHCHSTLLFSLLERDKVIQFATHHSSSQYIVVLVVGTGRWLYTVCYPLFIAIVHCCSRCYNGIKLYSLLPTIHRLSTLPFPFSEWEPCV